MEFPQLAISLVVILIAAKLMGELSERIRQPAVLGEVAAGVLIGPHVLGWVRGAEVIEIISLLAQLGAVLLLFEIGLRSDLNEFLKVGKSAFLLAVVGVALPLAFGYSAAVLLGFGGLVPLLVGAALTATSVGITARVLADLDQIHGKEAKIILGAAVVDDVLALILLATVLGIVATGQLAFGPAVVTALLAIAFLLGALLIGMSLAPYLLKAAGMMRTPGVVVVIALVFCLFLAWAAEQLGLAAIAGGFVAGLVLAKTEDGARISSGIKPIASVFVPIFFVWIGFAVNPGVFSPVPPGGLFILLAVAVLFVVAVGTKVLAGYSLRQPRLNRLAVGIGMAPRGEVGLIFAAMGLKQGIILADLYTALVTVLVLTVLVTPPLLTAVLRTTENSALTKDKEV